MPDRYPRSSYSEFCSLPAWCHYLLEDRFGEGVPLNSSGSEGIGYTHLLICVDRFTCWTIPLMDTSTEIVAHAFLMGWIAQFGVLATITSDRGGQFESNLWHCLIQLLWVHCICTTAYHPCSNGLVERLHCQVKALLMAQLPQTHWIETLPLVLAARHSHSSEGRHPA